MPDLPASRAEPLWYEDNERRLNVHGGDHQGMDGIVGTIHGSPSDRDSRKRPCCPSSGWSTRRCGACCTPRRLTRAASSTEQLTTIATILAACREGRVAALLARPTTMLWGRGLDDGLGHAEKRPGDVELVGVVIGVALDQGAVVFPLAPGELPYDPPVASVPRY